MALFDLNRLMLIASVQAISACASSASLPIRSASPPACVWPAAIIDSSGNPSFEIVDEGAANATLLREHPDSGETGCILSGIRWEMRQNHRGLVAQDGSHREIPLPAYPAHRPSCNGKYLSIDADVGNATVLWLIDSSTGQQQKTVLPSLENRYGATFPVVDPAGELAYVLAVSYTGAILTVRGERIEELASGKLPIRADVAVSQHGDSVLLHSNYVFVISAAERRFRGGLDLEGGWVWVRPVDSPKVVRPEIASVDFHHHTQVPNPELEMVSPALLFDGDTKTESLLAPGKHTFAIRLVRPVVDLRVHLELPAAASGATIVAAEAGGSTYFLKPVDRQDGKPFAVRPSSEARPPNLHTVSSGVTVNLSCACDGLAEWQCDNLCHVAEIGF